MRSKRKKGSTPVALLTGLGLPLLALFGVFSLIPYERMTDRWPLGITGEEVHAYQRWFDQRPDTMPKVDVPRLELSANGDCDGAREFTHQVPNVGPDAEIVQFSGVYADPHASII